VLAVSAALAAGVATLTAGSGSPQPASPTPAVAEIRAVPAAQASLFAILRAPRTTADSFAQVRPGAGPLGANPGLARSIREPSGLLSGGVVSVVPAAGAVCLRVPFAPTLVQWWCQGTAAAARGELLLALRPPGRLRASEQRIIGLVPDGVRSVAIAAAGGVRRLVPVHGNVYDALLFAPRSVTIEVPGGRTVRYPAP